MRGLLRKMTKVTKDMIIGECINKYPATMKILLEAGVHCVGCFAANMETIEMGLKGHGMPDEQVNKMLVDLNKAADSNGEGK